MSATLHNPWSEPSERLEARHVGRLEEREAVHSAVSRALRAERPLPLYFYGPRGVGKSHLLALEAERARGAIDAAGWALNLITEDVAACDNAEALVQRLRADPSVPAWMTLPGAPRPVSTRPTIVFIEGLDRQLDALGEAECRALRAQLDHDQSLFLVATGSRASARLTARDSSFYAWFDMRPLHRFTPGEGDALLKRVLHGTNGLASAISLEAVRLLADGEPRALVALALAVAAAPRQPLAGALRTALDQLTPHYQLRWHDLNPSEQRLMALLARLPRAVGPSEAAECLGGSSQTWSTIASRMAVTNTLRIDQEGRRSWYHIAEPLFRYWIEYRQSPWEQARVAWITDFMEEAAARVRSAAAQAHQAGVGGGATCEESPWILAEPIICAYGASLEPAARARVLARQVAEGAKGPLHRELAAIAGALTGAVGAG